MKKEDLTKKQLEEYEWMKETYPNYTEEKIFAQIKSNAGLLEGFEDYRKGEVYSPNNLKEWVSSLIRAEDKDGEFEEESEENKTLKELKRYFSDEIDQEGPSDFADPDETEAERLERQTDYFNEMRDHVFDSDEGYMQGQDPESIERQLSNRETTKIVEALQRQAMQQGDVARTANMPFDPNSVPSGIEALPGVYNQNPIEQAALGLGQGQGSNPALAQQQAQQQALRRIQLQTLQAGGGQGGYAHPGIGGGLSRFGGGVSNTPSYL
jgi:hypothetical protein